MGDFNCYCGTVDEWLPWLCHVRQTEAGQQAQNQWCTLKRTNVKSLLFSVCAGSCIFVRNEVLFEHEEMIVFFQVTRLAFSGGKGSRRKRRNSHLSCLTWPKSGTAHVRMHPPFCGQHNKHAGVGCTRLSLDESRRTASATKGATPARQRKHHS